MNNAEAGPKPRNEGQTKLFRQKGMVPMGICQSSRGLLQYRSGWGRAIDDRIFTETFGEILITEGEESSWWQCGLVGSS